jgi:predicted nucleic acid-binding protein
VRLLEAFAKSARSQSRFSGYIETTIVSYLTARPSPETIGIHRQNLTAHWWRHRLPDFEPVISRSVLEEAAKGNPEAAFRRLEKLRGIVVLPKVPEVKALAALLVSPDCIPAKAVEDAMHLAYCAYYRIPYIVTWNFKHIANATIQARLKKICENAGYSFPAIGQPTA